MHSFVGISGKAWIVQIFSWSRKICIFSHLALLDGQAQNTVSENHLLIYINHLQHLEEDGKSRFCDLQGMVVPDYEISSFECAIELTDLEQDLGDQMFELRMHLAAKSFFSKADFIFCGAVDWWPRVMQSSLKLFLDH